MEHWSEMLVSLHACNEAVTWARTQPSLAVAWESYHRADWMLWLAGKVSGPVGDPRRIPLALASADAANAARSKALQSMADIVRKHYPSPPVLAETIKRAQ
jgi:hypothetical protein